MCRAAFYLTNVGGLGNAYNCRSMIFRHARRSQTNNEDAVHAPKIKGARTLLTRSGYILRYNSECKRTIHRAFQISEFETYACYQGIATAVDGQLNIQPLFSIFGALDISTKFGRQVPKDSRGKDNPGRS